MKKIKIFVRLSWEISNKFYLLLLASCIISGLQMLMNLYIPAAFVDIITINYSLENGVKYIAIISISDILFYIIMQYIEAKLEIEKIYVSDMLDQRLSDKIMTIGYEKVENPYYLDLKQKALYAIETQDSITTLVYTICDVAKRVIFVAELFIILMNLSRFLIVTIIILGIIVALSYILYKKYEKECMNKLVGLNRRFSYYIGLCFDNTIQKDIRLNDMSGMLTGKVKHENMKILDFQREYRKYRGIFYGVLSCINIVQSMIAYSYIIFRTFLNNSRARLSYGQFTFYINAAVNAYNNTKEIIFGLVTISQMLNYLDPYVEFMEINDDKSMYGTVRMASKIDSLEFKDVSFKYPKTEKMVLSNVSFKIVNNEKVSIVGINGAGKSTIVKLICRLYKPTEGEICINGINIWEYSKSSYDRNITTVFQDYKVFAMSILENISCVGKGDYYAAVNWLDKLEMGYLDKKYVKGIYTELNKAYEDEGIDLSGGEKQKIAIARALYKGGSMYILDEPTSALDPKSESEIYAKFENLTNKKMTIYISHRMSCNTLCDKVLVLNDGKVIDFDCHENLIKKCGSLYYKMFMAQAENYVN